MGSHPLTSHDPRWPYEVATISFTLLDPLPRGGEDGRRPYLDNQLAEALQFSPALTPDQSNALEFTTWLVKGRRLLHKGKQYRLYNMAARICSIHQWERSEAQLTMEAVANGLWDLPDEILGSPLLHNTGIHTWGWGVPVTTEISLKMVLKTLRVHTPFHRQGEMPIPVSKEVHVEAPQHFEDMLQGVLTTTDLKKHIPRPIFSRFFNEKPSVWAYKTFKYSAGEEKWRVVVPTEGPYGGPKNPVSLQNIAKMGVLENCLKMKRAGLRFMPY